MLHQNPEKRFDIKQVLKHPFFIIKPSKQSLDNAIKKLKKYNQRLKLRASQIAVYWMNLMQKKKAK